MYFSYKFDAYAAILEKTSFVLYITPIFHSRKHIYV